MTARCASVVEARAAVGLPRVGPGDDLPELVIRAIESSGMTLGPGDIVCVASKVVSRAEGQFVDLGAVTPTARALELAGVTGHEPALVEVVLRESVAVSRVARGVLVVRHRLGFVSANAAIDRSNALPPDARPGSGPWVLLLPRDPDESARRLRARLGEHVGVVITDSLGRAFRQGSVGAAIGVAGLPPLDDYRGRRDLDGRALEYTVTALADQVAAVADLTMGQAAEGRAVVVVRGVVWEPSASGGAARDLVREGETDLYA